MMVGTSALICRRKAGMSKAGSRTPISRYARAISVSVNTESDMSCREVSAACLLTSDQGSNVAMQMALTLAVEPAISMCRQHTNITAEGGRLVVNPPECGGRRASQTSPTVHADPQQHPGRVLLQSCPLS